MKITTKDDPLNSIKYEKILKNYLNRDMEV